MLVSDEIHQDMALFGHKHQSFNTVNEDFKEFSLILSSATKTFNIAGTKNSYAIIENPKLRLAFQKRQLANNQHESQVWDIWQQKLPIDMVKIG